MRDLIRRLGWGLLAIALGSLAAGSVAAARRGGGARTSPTHPKRGIASARFLSSDPRLLSSIGATWAYDWSATPPPAGRGPAWVPMVWGAGSVTLGTIASLTAARHAGRASALLGFNEPDSPGQSNMHPSQAAALWPQLQRTGLRLGSPAPAVATDGWLATFMALARARHLRVDFIALHYYQDFTNPAAVGQLRSQLVSIHDAYHLPIWITEIGAIDIRGWGEPMLHKPTGALATSYMRRLFAMLDGLRFVQRYAWFTDDCSNDTACRMSSLFTGASKLTSAGSTFASTP